MNGKYIGTTDDDQGWMNGRNAKHGIRFEWDIENDELTYAALSV
jgi:hypothetical protein